MNKLRPIKIPEIRFENGWLLTNAFMAYREEIKRFKGSRAPTFAKMARLIKDREKEWKKVGRKILRAMQRIAGLNFYQNLIDVYFVYGWRAAFSNPMVLSMRYQGEEFIDILTHELLHRLLTDNIQGKDGGLWLAKIYPGAKDIKVACHVLVHAIHKEIYLTVLKRPDRLKYDVNKCQDWPAYKRAWQIVTTHGHLNIIDRFKKSR